METRRKLPLFALLAVLLLSAGCGAKSATSATSTSATSLVPPASVPVVREGSAGAYLELSSTSVSSGGELAVTVVVINNTGAPLTIASCGPAFYSAGFESAAVARTDQSFLSCLGPLQQIPIGESQWPTVARASYSSCGGSGVRPPPPCVDQRPPGLPVGDYRLVVGAADPRAPVPDAVSVVVR